MGDRANIRFIPEDGNPIYFYTHWGGYRLPSVVYDSMTSGRDRWADPSYLARIVFTKLIDGDDSNLGYGISHTVDDNENPIITINSIKQTVEIGSVAIPFANLDYNTLVALYEQGGEEDE